MLTDSSRPSFSFFWRGRTAPAVGSGIEPGLGQEFRNQIVGGFVENAVGGNQDRHAAERTPHGTPILLRLEDFDC
jgi:hypothetical protein